MKKMRKLQIKSKTTTLSLILLLTLSSLLILLPTTIAQETYREKTTYAYVGATPNPIGVNQQVLFHVGITDYLYVVTDGWEGLTLTLTKPDGSTEIMGPFRTDATGGTGTAYVPTMVGTYKLQTHFPAQWYNWTRAPMFDPDIYGDMWYKASDSEIIELEVTEEQREYYPGHELPSSYWTRPIDAQLHEWASISANWETRPANLYAPYNEYAPESAHVLWAKPLTYGGLAGGNMGNHAFDCGDAYEGKFASPVIIGGVLFYNKYQSRMPQGGIVAVDLHTGEELWFRNNSRVSFGQVFYWDSYNMHSVFGYVWETSGSTWNAYNPLTGDWVYTMEGVPTSSVQFGASYTVRGPKGEILIYNVNLADGWMTLWNSSRVVSNAGSWRPQGRTYDNAAERGREWNKTIPTGLPGSVRATLSDRIIGDTTTGWTGMGDNPIEQWCISLSPGQEGTLLWQKTWQPPAGELSITYGGSSLEDDILVYEVKETRQYYGFNLDTGNQIWGPTPSQQYLGIYGIETNIAYGKIFSTGMAGILYCYDAQTGNLLWEYDAVDHYTEILWSDNWPLFQVAITDGKIYLQHHEHSPVDPKPRGAPFLCIDIESGEEIWSLPIRGTNWGGDPAIGDSIIAMYNTYDQRIFALGKGPSATTIEAPLVAVPKGSGVIIRGTVTDVSPGTKDSVIALRYPYGVPVMSDNSMTDWMKHLYLQMEMPNDATGVPVKIEIVDPNGAYAWIGTATTDSDGNFAYSMKPAIEGQYMIIATFDGSNSYYGSHAITYISVDPASSGVNLSPIQGSVNEVKSSVNTLDSSVNDLENCVTDLETSVSDLSGLEGSVNNLQGSTSGFEASLSNLESSVANQTTFMMAILALVVVAIAIAAYSVIKNRK